MHRSIRIWGIKFKLSKLRISDLTRRAQNLRIDSNQINLTTDLDTAALMSETRADIARVESVAFLRVKYTIFRNFFFKTLARRCLYNRVNIAAFSPRVVRYAPACTFNPTGWTRLLSSRYTGIESRIFYRDDMKNKLWKFRMQEIICAWKVTIFLIKFLSTSNPFRYILFFTLKLFRNSFSKPFWNYGIFFAIFIQIPILLSF